MRVRCFSAVLAFCLIAAPLSFAGNPTGAEDTCVLFGVQDEGQADSRLFRVNILDPATGDVILELTDLVACPNCDWEAIALDPTDGQLYTLAGGNGNQDGKLWRVDKDTGALTLIGNTGVGNSGTNEIVAASFRRSDGVLWVFQEGTGLLTIDTDFALATVQYMVDSENDQFGDEVRDNWEGLGWDLPGAYLYGSDGTTLYRWDPAAGGSTLRVCDNLGDDGAEIEALEFMFNGNLIGGVNEGSAATRMILIEFPADTADFGPDACTITPLGASLVPSDDRDIESFVFEPCPYCGDGDLDPGEECDEGINNNDNPGSTCRTDCTYCGDGNTDPGEECDNGSENSNEPGACRPDCTNPECGDGIQDPGEECDEGADNSDEPGSTCRTDCTVPVCGDGIVGNTPGETCDPPGSAVGSPGEVCSANCTYCGDGGVNAGEQCDDGNELNGDGCEANCTRTPTCGDGIVGNTPGETCDPPGSAVGSPGEVCSANCTYCGDGGVNAGEQCDDGNELNGDGCEANCTRTPTCGDGIVGNTPGETCDPPGSAVGSPGEVCSVNCTYCGDGGVNAGEQCDDGNEHDGDGCSKTCAIEGTCFVIIDEDGVDNDMRSVENAASACSVTPDILVNDQGIGSPLPANSVCSSRNLDSSDSLPVECGNPPFVWNKRVASNQCGSNPDGNGRLALMPTGQVDDEGWFAPPPPFLNGGGFRVIRYADQRPSSCNRYSSGQSVSVIQPGVTKHGYDLWVEEFVAGIVRQPCLDKVRDVEPLRNQDLIQLVGKTCTAIVYDSDISMNTQPIYANLQGRRDGAFTFKIEAAEVAGSLPESKSSSSLYDLWLRILAPQLPTTPLRVKIDDHEPDSIQVTRATFNTSTGVLTVEGTSNYPGTDNTPPYLEDPSSAVNDPNSVYNTPRLPTPAAPDDNFAYMTVSVDNPADNDAAADPIVDPLIREVRMPRVSGNLYRVVITVPAAAGSLRGRRLSIQTDEGGAYNVFIQRDESSLSRGVVESR